MAIICLYGTLLYSIMVLLSMATYLEVSSSLCDCCWLPLDPVDEDTWEARSGGALVTTGKKKFAHINKCQMNKEILFVKQSLDKHLPKTKDTHKSSEDTAYFVS